MFSSAASEELAGGVLDLALRLRGTPPAEEAELGAPGGGPGQRWTSARSESAFQFERENVQELVILFTDIQGYSKKAQFLSPQQLSALLQDYEKILLALMGAHTASSSSAWATATSSCFTTLSMRCWPPSGCRNPCAGSTATATRTRAWSSGSASTRQGRAQGAGRRPGEHGEHRLTPGELGTAGLRARLRAGPREGEGLRSMRGRSGASR